MFAVIFEVKPRPERWDDYLALAKLLKPELERIDGFVDNERFESRRTKGRLLSLSTWRDEKALVRWRTLAIHHQVQEKGRFEVFEDYHLRVGEITADNCPPTGLAVAQQRFDETEVGLAKAVTISELDAAPDGTPACSDLAQALGVPPAGSAGVADQELFDSIYSPGKQLLLASWRDAGAAEAWRPGRVDADVPRHRQIRIIRDYGMADRREAPQYYPPAGAGV